MFNNVAKIKWQGEEYACEVNMKLVQLMESNGFNAAVTNARCSAFGVPPLSLVAEMLHWLLSAGGCSVTEEDIYAELMHNSSDADNLEIIKSAQALSELFIPKIKPVVGSKVDEKKK